MHCSDMAIAGRFEVGPTLLLEEVADQVIQVKALRERRMLAQPQTTCGPILRYMSWH